MILFISDSLTISHPPNPHTIFSSDSFFSFSRRDTLVFQEGRLTVVGFVPAGFSPGAYSVQSGQDPKDTLWNAALYNDGKGRIEWEGRIKGDRMDGTAVWHEKDGTIKRFRFKGTRKSA